ncbi:MAG: S1-like domain-containing RNA-binding protein [bacterium]
MLEIGNYNNLLVKTTSSVGVYLTDEEDDVLLPTKYVPGNINVGDHIEVFVYLDNENRPVATTLKPLATVGEFAFLSVKDVNPHGAFLDWGIAKDIFVSYSEQRQEMIPGNKYLVYIFIDEVSGRIAASTKWMRFLDSDLSNLEDGEEVELLIAEKTELGYKAIINNQYEGLLYKNEVFENLLPGEKHRGYIKQLRDDGKIDLRLQQKGYEHIEDVKLLVLKKIEELKGVLELGDKSSPEDIYSQLKISKKAFKKAIGGLFKERKITISDFKVNLVEK